MTHQESFRTLWGKYMESRGLSRLRKFPEAHFHDADINQDDCYFLVQTGLPEDAAPFLSFSPESIDWIPIELRRCNHMTFVGIGSEGSGNPIVLCHQGVFILDHENRFTPTGVNSTVQGLAHSLLSFSTFVEALNAPGVTVDSAREASNMFLRDLRAIDLVAASGHSWWLQQVDMFLSTDGWL